MENPRGTLEEGGRGGEAEGGGKEGSQEDRKGVDRCNQRLEQKAEKMRQTEERKTVGVFQFENHYRLDDYDNTSHCPLQFKNVPSLMAVLHQ